MRALKLLTLTAVAGLCFLATLPKTHAQVSVSIGVEPSCPYGYYDYAPYSCAPYGYYGPEWFNGGVFIGAGNWFHGPANFNGHVDNRLDVQHGYKGALPKVGEKPAPNRAAPPKNFKGNEVRDGHGHAVGDKH